MAASRSAVTTTTVVPLEPGDSAATRRAAADRAPSTPAASRRSVPLGRVLRVATRPVPMGWPQPTVDEWGRAPWLIEAVGPLAHLRWATSVLGVDRLPVEGPVLVVINTRRLALTSVSTAVALSEALGRPVRFAGRPDTVPFGPLLRQLGGILSHPDEIRGALRSGEIVLVGAQATTDPRRVGVVDPGLLAPAIRASVPVHVAATASAPFDRRARVEVGAAVRGGRTRRGPLAEVELAERAQHRLQEMIDEMGVTRTGLSVPDRRRGDRS